MFGTSTEETDEREKTRQALIEYHTQGLVDAVDRRYLENVEMVAQSRGLTRDQLLDKLVAQQRGVEQSGSS